MSWIKKYLEYTVEQESPELFHFWCSLGILASTVGRNISLVKTYDDFSKLYPNLYIILVSPSGRCRKGGAIGFANKLLSDSETRVYLEAITKRALTRALADEIVVVDKEYVGESKIVIISDELEVFLGKDAVMSGLLALLTRLYECPDKWEYRTSTQGNDYLYNTCINIIGATIPSWFHDLPVQVMSSGFFARLVIVFQQETPRRNPGVRRNNKKFAHLQSLRKELVEFLLKLKEIKKPVELSSSAVDLYESWYSSREPDQDERLASFYEREHDLVLKVAMLLAISEGDLFRGNVIGTERVRDALIAVENVKKTMHLAYAGIGEHLAAKGYERMVQQIVSAGGEIEHSKLLNKTWHWVGDTEGFKKIMELCCETGRVKRMIRGRKIVYRVVKKEED